MKKYENISLVGLYLIIAGVFLPWHKFSEYYRVPGAIGEVSQKISGFVLGYNSMMGYVILVSAIVTCIFVLIPKENEIGKRLLAAQAFMTAFIAMIFVISGIAPVFLFDSITPHIGLAAITLGSLMTIIGIKNGLKEFSTVNNKDKSTDTNEHDEDEQEERVRERTNV